MGVLNTPFRIGTVEVPNRVLLAPLAGIGNWFVRLQARRHGAGLAVSEMVSSFAIHHRNDKTMTELLRIHPDEGPVSIQLFGQDADVMRSAAEPHKGVADYDRAARLVESLAAPVILTGGLRDREAVLAAYERTGAAAVMLARGSLGNPWLFEELLSGRTENPSADEILDE